MWRLLVVLGLAGCATASGGAELDAACKRLQSKFAELRMGGKHRQAFAPSDLEVLKGKSVQYRLAADKALDAGQYDEHVRLMSESLKLSIGADLLPIAEEQAFELAKAAICER